MIATHETYELNVPITHQGRDYTELQMRRPTARDILRGTKQNGTPLEIDVRQLVDLCEVPKDVIDGHGRQRPDRPAGHPALFRPPLGS